MSIDDQPAPPQPAEWIRFPPFPQPPPNKRIISFKEFKASGIQIVIDPQPGHVELDGLDIPTVALRVKHALTETEHRKKKGKKPATRYGRRRTWWEEWEEGEDLRRMNTSLADRVDRLHTACQEFRTGRSWPSPESGVPQLWDMWRLYIGIISSVQQPPGLHKKNFQPLEAEEENSDDEDDVMEDSKPQTVIAVDEETARLKREQDMHREEESNAKQLDEQAMERSTRRQERKSANMSFFFNDPETAVKIFFSAHFRDKGYVWNDQRCRDAPIIIEFFLRFVLRNRILPELEAELKKALDVTRKARVELPATSVIGKSLKEAFGKGCEKIMGEFTQAIFQATVLPLEGDSSPEDGERDAKKRRLDGDEDEDLQAFKASVDSSNLQFIDAKAVDHAAEMRKDAIADNIDLNGVEVAPGASWGSAPMPMGTIDAQANIWRAAGDANDANETVKMDMGGWGSSSAWATLDPESTSAYDWLGRPENELLALMGPTVLPLTHTTGVVMRSVRRIVRIVPPEHGGGSVKGKDTGAEVKGEEAGKSAQAEAVEEDFARRLVRVVTAPWVKVGNHIGSDIQAPSILPDSRGPVVPVPDKKELDDAAGVAHAADLDADAFDPMKGEFTWLVEPSMLGKLIEGMGVSGTWVQLARRDTSESLSVEELKPMHDRWNRKGKDIKVGGPGTNVEATKFWYLEQCHAVLVSFHTDRYYPDQD